MPTVTALPLLDVVIGLAFLYFLLSVICSSITEIIASAFRLRARNLESGIRTLLGSKQAAERFFEGWRIESLGTPRWLSWGKERRPRKPSYIPARAFPLAALDTLSPEVTQEVTERDSRQRGASDVLATTRQAVEGMEDGVARQRLIDALDRARGSVDTFRANLEDAFNSVMDRAAGWYKRKVQIILFVVALAVAGGLNADTLNVADRLAKDDAVRARVVAEAQRAAQAQTPQDLAEKKAPTPAEVEEQIQQARATALPLGWGGENVPDGPWAWAIFVKSGGILLTAAAVMLGAPFWFDVLGKAARLRSTGNRIGTPKDDETAPQDRDERPRRSPPGGPARRVNAPDAANPQRSQASPGLVPQTSDAPVPASHGLQADAGIAEDNSPEGGPAPVRGSSIESPPARLSSRLRRALHELRGPKVSDGPRDS